MRMDKSERLTNNTCRKIGPPSASSYTVSDQC